MKERLKKVWKNKWKLVIPVIVLLSLIVGVVIYSNMNSKDNTAKLASETATIELDTTQNVAISVAEESTVAKKAFKEDTENTNIMESTRAEKPEIENKEIGKSINEGTNEKEATVNHTEELETEVSISLETATPVQENNYVPISEGWKDAKSAKGDITTAQKADLDTMIEEWKSRTISDMELKEKIEIYLGDQGVMHVEVSVTSKGYALYDVLPEIDLRDGGNLYSFVGIYSTGEKNPDGTNKTVCYNWSAFVF